MIDDTYFVSKHVWLRALEPEDLEVLYEMENDPQTWDITNFTVPYSRFALRQYIENVQNDMFADRQLRLMIVSRSDNQIIGTVDITDFEPRHARGEVGIAVRHAYQGKGYATETLHLLCKYAFGFLRMHQLTAHVAVDNEASIRLFSTCGFVQCGLLKEWWCVSGIYKDVILMQKLGYIK